LPYFSPKIATAPPAAPGRCLTRQATKVLRTWRLSVALIFQLVAAQAAGKLINQATCGATSEPFRSVLAEDILQRAVEDG
jgi:hypothetical protein